MFVYFKRRINCTLCKLNEKCSLIRNEMALLPGLDTKSAFDVVEENFKKVGLVSLLLVLYL